MEVVRRTLFESNTLQIGWFAARPVSDACGDVERQDLNAVVLPLSGVFSKHEGPGRHVVGTPSHAVFIASDTPYRISFPGGIGDRSLTLKFDEALTPEVLAPGRLGRWGHRQSVLASHGLLPANVMVLRNLLRAELKKGQSDDFEIEALGLDLLSASLRSMRSPSLPPRRSARVRSMRAVERVKEAVAVAPADKWSIARLATVANLSPFHLCHVFREMVGTSVYDYVLHERLACSLDAVLDGTDDLTTIALDAGFASHSHFTARFGRFFGCPPATLRRLAAEQIAELRKIMTARRPG